MDEHSAQAADERRTLGIAAEELGDGALQSRCLKESNDGPTRTQGRYERSKGHCYERNKNATFGAPGRTTRSK